MNRLVLLIVLSSLLLLSQGQSALANESPDELASQRLVVSEKLQKVERLTQELHLISKQIETASKADKQALDFRHNERSFQLLTDLGQLADSAAKLPETDPQRTEIETMLDEGFGKKSQQAFASIETISQLTSSYKEELEGLDGLPGVRLQAYIETLQNLRIKYYGALINLMESRTALGLSNEGIAEELKVQLYQRTEILVGRVEFKGATLKSVQTRLNTDPQNAEIDTAEKAFKAQHTQDLQKLKTLVGLLERLDVDVSAYKEVLLQQGQNLSVREIQGDVVMNLMSDGWTSLKQSATAMAPDIVIRIILFILIMLLARILAKLARRVVTMACERPGIDVSVLLKNVLVSVSSGTIMAIGLLVALSQIGISLAPMLAGLGVAGFIVGFALQDTLGNFAAGSMILIYRPYDVDDFVEVTGASGLVRKMSLVSTTITTFDNQTLVVPNSKIWGDVIKNVTAQKVRRVDLQFGIGYGDDIELAERVLAEILADHDLILERPEPMIKLHELADSSVNFVVRPWTKTENYWDVYWDITREVKMRFDREGISIPFPQRDVHLQQAPA